MGSLRQLYWQQRIEQRQLTAAAKIIQNAYRQYRRRAQTRQKQLELQYKAAVVIQTHYRRYKQYCYCKKLHQAAVLIQRQFRLYKATKRKTEECSNVQEFHSNDSTSQQPIIDAFAEFLENTVKQNAASTARQNEPVDQSEYHSPCSSDECWNEKEQKAAALIQHAFRCHRKRRAVGADGLVNKIKRFSHNAFIDTSGTDPTNSESFS